MTATLEDLEALRRHIGANPGLPTDVEVRLLDHIDTTIRVRQAQKTKSRTATHGDMMAAYSAAVHRWEHDREAACSDYHTDIHIWTTYNPRPLLRDFMRASARPSNICPTCGQEVMP